MSVNYYTKHLYVILEDEEYQKIMTGVNLSLNVNDQVIKICNFSDGWGKVFKDLENSIRLLNRFRDRYILLLMDFDYAFEDRIKEFRMLIPTEFTNRIFILGIDNKESEDLAKYFKCKAEEVGKKLVENCPTSDLLNWKNTYLKCNLPEIERMRENGVFDWLFIT
jgi:hypothetical protein